MEKISKNYVRTERAHFMCPNMHFGILAQIKCDYEKEKMQESMTVLQNAHPFLRSLIAEESGTKRLYYQVQDCLEIPVTERTNPDLWQQDYDDVAGCGWNVKKECLLKVFVYPKENGFQILFISHHLLCDGRGLLRLTEEFAGYYAEGVIPRFTEEKLIRSLHDLPPGSDLSFGSKLMIRSINKKWKKEQCHVSYEEYLIFEKHYVRNTGIKREITTIEGQAFAEIQALCKEHGFSINDYLIAKIMWEDHRKKVIIAADIRSQIGCYRQGAMGNYATAFRVVIGKKAKDMISLAQQVNAKVADLIRKPQKTMLILACYLHMQPDLIDAVAIAALGGFASKAGAFAGKNLFGYVAQNGYGITNLGKVQSDVITEAVFIPPSSPANKKTWGVLTVNEHMKICSSVLHTGR